jgi:GAF domain-containing protein
MAGDPERAAPTDPADERVLHRIISMVSSSLELEETMRSVVTLIAEGSHSPACFLWIVEDDGRLVLRAASEQYAASVGVATLEAGEGIAGWVAAHRQAVFLADDAISDPRYHFFAEFEEQLFQSMVSVPLLGRDGVAFGVIGIHSKAPRSLSEEDARFVSGAASLVAGAIENARLHTATRRRMEALERIGELAIRTASAATAEELIPAVEETARALLGADEVVVLPGAGGGPAAAAGAIDVPLEVDGDVLGRLIATRSGKRPFEAADRDLAHGIAAQAAIGLRKIELIERLTERAMIRELFDSLARGTSEAPDRSRRFGLDFGAPLVALELHPWRPVERSEQARLDAAARFAELIAAAVPASLVDREGDALRSLVPADEPVIERLREAIRADPRRLPVLVGLSTAFTGAAAAADGLAAASLAARIAPVVLDRPGVVGFGDLGPYRYLVHVPVADGAPDRHREAVRALRAHDRKRGTSLVRTLEELLARRGNVGSTSEALYVHPNTLRQRLARITAVAGLDLQAEDWMALQIALRIERLREGLGPVRFGDRAGAVRPR